MQSVFSLSHEMGLSFAIWRRYSLNMKANCPSLLSGVMIRLAFIWVSGFTAQSTPSRKRQLSQFRSKGRAVRESDSQATKPGSVFSRRPQVPHKASEMPTCDSSWRCNLKQSQGPSTFTCDLPLLLGVSKSDWGIRYRRYDLHYVEGMPFTIRRTPMPNLGFSQGRDLIQNRTRSKRPRGTLLNNHNALI